MRRSTSRASRKANTLVLLMLLLAAMLFSALVVQAATTTGTGNPPPSFTPTETEQVRRLYIERSQQQAWAAANPELVAKLGYKYQAPSRFTFGDIGIKEIYVSGVTHLRKDEPLTEAQKIAGIVGAGLGEGDVNCAGLHPANPECCGYEYYKEWGSACGIPGVLETFNELKESACLAAQNANSVGEFEKAATAAAETPIQCKSLFNSVAGFCEPGSGQPVGDVIATGIAMKPEVFGALAAPDKNQVYVRIEPTGQENKDWMVVRGYIVSTVKRQKLATTDAKAAEKIAAEKTRATALRNGKQTSKPDEFYLNAELQFVPDLDVEANLASFFEDSEKNRKLQAGQMAPGFDLALCKNSISERMDECRRVIAPKVYFDIKSRMGVTDKVYIVRPDRDGVLRSAQCMCIPAVTSYLKYWKNILTAVRQCFEAVRLTGEARPGVCQAVLSRYVCDMLFDVLTCFTQKYNVPGQGTSFSGSGGIGDVMGALSKSGNDMQQGITSRYGDTSLYSTMFVERKLLHSVCAFAFTGTWDLDVAGMYEQTVDEMPLETQGFIYPAERRFLSFNPVTRPSGLATHIYHFGVGLAAGSDIRYQLELVCSNTARCEPRDGFEQGKCDCFGRNEQRQLVSDPRLSGSLRKSEIVDAEVFYTVQGGDPASAVRYDTAVLSWETMDNAGVIDRKEARFAIHATGERPPNFCRVDPLSLSFRCDLGIGDYSGGRLTEIRPLYPDNQDYFKLGDPVRFQATVLMKVPEGSKSASGCIGVCPWTKWLNYNISNQNGGELVTGVRAEDMYLRSDLKFEADGEDPKVIPIRVGGVDWKLEKQNFVAAPKQAVAGVETGEAWMAPLVDVTYGGSFITEHVLVIRPDGTGYKVELYKLGKQVRLPTSAGQTQWFDREGGVVATDTITQVTPQGTSLFESVPSYKGAVRVHILSKTKLTTPVEFLLKTQASAPTQDPCKDAALTQWRALFSLHDSSKVAGGTAYEYDTQQITYDFVTEELQQKTVLFNVICSDKGPSGRTAGVRQCGTDPTVAQPSQCFCGTDAELAEANKRFAANNADTTILNCGPDNSVNPGASYCIYIDVKTPSLGRKCDVLGGSKPVVATPDAGTGGTTGLGSASDAALLADLQSAIKTTNLLPKQASRSKTDYMMEESRPFSSTTSIPFNVIPGLYTFTFDYSTLADGNYQGLAFFDGKTVKWAFDPGQKSLSITVPVPHTAEGTTKQLVVGVIKDGKPIGGFQTTVIVNRPISITSAVCDSACTDMKTYVSSIAPGEAVVKTVAGSPLTIKIGDIDFPTSNSEFKIRFESGWKDYVSGLQAQSLW